MRPIALRLRDILEAADTIREFIEEVESREYFEGSPLYQSAILYQLIIIGESIAHIDDEFKAKYEAVPWHMLKRFRNFAVHQYFGVDWIEVWNSAQRLLGETEDQVIDIMQREFPDF